MASWATAQNTKRPSWNFRFRRAGRTFAKLRRIGRSELETDSRESPKWIMVLAVPILDSMNDKGFGKKISPALVSVLMQVPNRYN